MMTTIEQLIRPCWPPMKHIEKGWKALNDDERATVRDRLESILSSKEPIHHGSGSAALATFFSFLAQVETIAIEIPLRFLPHAHADMRLSLRRQLVDEVFHSILFARIAYELCLPNHQPPPPLQSAEALLERIRSETDLAVSATLLNLVAESWIEVLFEQALSWGIADPVFRAVLADEARHVTEADIYIGKHSDGDKVGAAVREFELGLVEVLSEPSVAISISTLAGPDGLRTLVSQLTARHSQQLKNCGLESSADWLQLNTNVAGMVENDDLQEEVAYRQTLRAIDDTSWRRAARAIWKTPTSPTMRGSFDVAMGHIPKKLPYPLFGRRAGSCVGDRRGRSTQPGCRTGPRVAAAASECRCQSPHGRRRARDDRDNGGQYT